MEPSKTIQLEDLGFTVELAQYRKRNIEENLITGRVVSEHKERYMVKTTHNDFECEIIGNLRFTANSRADFPAVGDWVAVSPYDQDKALIHAIYPRKTMIERQAIGKTGEKQIIASNIDVGLILLSSDRDFNINRLQRYLAICQSSGVGAVIILTKIDLLSEHQLTQLTKQVKERANRIPLVCISNKTQQGFQDLNKHIMKGKTYCLLGSSGVGKSTLINSLSGHSKMKTGQISTSTHKGKHITSHRELHLMESGGIIIDNPGMREVGIADAGTGIDLTFNQIIQLSEHCRYADCSHTSEDGCTVKSALDQGEIDEMSYQNYLKMVREKDHFESTVAERRKKEKSFGKMVKHFKKNKPNSAN